MLLNLVITNFAIIDRLEVAFEAGFNVLTGETGAGKSIVLDAFGLLLGDRARPDLVRAGADEATVEALFQVEGHEGLKGVLAEAGLPGAGEGELILRRVVQSGGRSRAYVNGAMVTLSQLQPLAEQLVAVCGQHEHQSLLQRRAHLAMLDRFGRLSAALDDYRASFSRLQDLRGRLASLEQADRDRRQRLDFLRHQSREIAAANLSVEEEEALLAERLLLQNAERLVGVTSSGYEVLYGEDGAVCERLGRLADDLQELNPVSAELGSLGETVRRALFDLEDVAAQLRQQLGRVSFEAGRQDEVEARLAEFNKLKRKYAPTLAEILALQAELDTEIEALERVAETREDLQQQCLVLESTVREKGGLLSEGRRRAADRLAAAVGRELGDLAMPGARFAVEITSQADPGPEGLEKVEFLVSPNPGEPLMPLGKIASGGELSRLMLALKRVAPGMDEVPTVIFDEVDAGIGGETATAVGRKLFAVSRETQVLCVTHLPQVAAFADRQYRVRKSEAAGRTQTDVERLSTEARVREMARMLGGANVTEQTLLHARELIEASAGRD